MIFPVSLEPERRGHVWSYDLVHHRTDDGRAFRALNIVYQFSFGCLAIRLKRKLNSTDVVDALTEWFVLRGVPAFVLSVNVLSLLAQIVHNWIAAVRAKTAYIAPSSPWETAIAKASMPDFGMNF